MIFSFDKLFGIHEGALKLWSQRAEILSNNIANADTPNFKARDVDFKQVLQQMQGGRGDDIAEPRVATLEEGFAENLQYRQPLHPAMDNNTVDAQVEITQFLENSQRFQVSFTFLNGKVTKIISALRGD